MKRSKKFMIISASIALCFLIVAIALYSIACVTRKNRTAENGAKRVGFEIIEVATNAYFNSATIKSGDKERQTDDRQKISALVRTLDLIVWYEADEAEKTTVSIVFLDEEKKENKTYEITLCENNVIYYDGKYFVSEGSTAFHDAVISTANELLL